MLRQSIFALLYFASVGLVVVSYERARVLGAIAAVVVAIVGFFSLNSSVTDFIKLAVAFPVYVGALICLILVAVWFCGPGSALWDAIFRDSSATVRRVLVGSCLSAIIAAAAWLTAAPPDYAGMAYAKLAPEVGRKAAEAAQLNSGVLEALISGASQQANNASTEAIHTLRNGALPMRGGALNRLDEMKLEEARAVAARATIEKITLGSLETRERAIRDQAAKSAGEAAVRIKDENLGKLQAARKAAVEETQREQLKVARETLTGVPWDKLDQHSKELLSEISERLSKAGDAVVTAGVRNVMAAAPEQIQAAARDAVRAAAKAAIDQMQYQIDALFTELTAALKAEADRKEVDRMRVAAAELVRAGARGQTGVVSAWTPRNMPGGPDKAYDVLGITPGMDCDQAAPIVSSRVPGVIIPTARNYDSLGIPKSVKL
jgi:hypothetical protein